MEPQRSIRWAVNILVTLLGQSKPPGAIVAKPGHEYFALMPHDYRQVFVLLSNEKNDGYFYGRQLFSVYTGVAPLTKKTATETKLAVS